MQANLITMPVSPIEKLARVFSTNLFMPDTSDLYILMGSVAANLLDGAPVWLMFVGPPGCGKSELLNSLLEVPGLHEAADIASEAAFLSGTSKRERAVDATGGLLCQVGMHGGIILNDFTSILSKPSDKLNTIMSVLREAYGGRWTRHIGSEGGRLINWQGKLALFAGVTGKIDQHHQTSAELGERWIYWRYDKEDPDEGYGQCVMATNQNRGSWRNLLRETVRTFFKDLGLEFGVQTFPRKLTLGEQLRAIGLATLTARCRSGVARDFYSKDVVGPREVELATRLSTILCQLLLGLDFIGVPMPAIWRLLTKVALDSMPRARKLAILAVMDGQEPESEPVTVTKLIAIVGCSKPVVERLVQDLELHGVVRREGKHVLPTEWLRENYCTYVLQASY